MIIKMALNWTLQTVENQDWAIAGRRAVVGRGPRAVGPSGRGGPRACF